MIPGIGWRAVSKLALDSETRVISTELTSRPDADHWRWITAAQLQNQQSASTDTNSQRLRAGRSQSQDRADRSVYVQYDRADSASTDSTPESVVQAVSGNYAVTLRNFDSTPFPSRGWGLGLEVGGGTTLGAQHEPYGRVLARALTYLPLERRASATGAAPDAGRIALRAEAGVVWARDGVALPSTQLFLTGGDTSVRGYTYRDIGVTRSSGLVTPGRVLATGSVEWQRPLLLDGRASDWESTLFLDAGAVADQVQDLRARVGVGAGVRWKSPIGPLQIDLAYGLEVKLLRLHMNVGFSF
jgi:translocation and assembly module TamA